MQPKGTRFPGISGPKAVASPGAVGDWGARGPGGELIREEIWKPMAVFVGGVTRVVLCWWCNVGTVARKTPDF